MSVYGGLAVSQGTNKLSVIMMPTQAFDIFLHPVLSLLSLIFFLKATLLYQCCFHKIGTRYDHFRRVMLIDRAEKANSDPSVSVDTRFKKCGNRGIPLEVAEGAFIRPEMSHLTMEVTAKLVIKVLVCL